MIIQRFMCSLLASLSLCSCGGAASSPESLAKELQKAMNHGDFAVALALADIGDAPAELRFAYLDQVLECSSGSKCVATIAPMDAAFRQSLADQAKEIGADPLDAEGRIVLTSKAADGTGSGSMQMPFAKIGGSYKIASLHVSSAELAKQRERTGEDLLKEMFAGGIYDSASGTRRTDWESAATKLPADGGTAGAALVRQTQVMAAAVAAKDPDAAMHAGGRWAMLVFADKDYDGKPIARELRQRKLYVQSLRMLRDVKVRGGYQLGDDAALIIEARNGVGWIERGAVLLSRDGDNWDVAGKQTVSYPQ